MHKSCPRSSWRNRLFHESPGKPSGPKHLPQSVHTAVVEQDMHVGGWCCLLLQPALGKQGLPRWLPHLLHGQVSSGTGSVGEHKGPSWAEERVHQGHLTGDTDLTCSRLCKKGVRRGVDSSPDPGKASFWFHPVGVPTVTSLHVPHAPKLKGPGTFLLEGAFPPAPCPVSEAPWASFPLGPGGTARRALNKAQGERSLRATLD